MAPVRTVRKLYAPVPYAALTKLAARSQLRHSKGASSLIIYIHNHFLRITKYTMAWIKNKIKYK